ncbi:MAG: thermonuclease family protein [Gammaproteobacteria bacterium]|nr:thermonuclease family protein [Gammaproteobacteria bacterium]
MSIASAANTECNSLVPPPGGAGFLRSRPVLAGIFTLLILHVGRFAWAGPECAITEPGSPARIVAVIDGDTVILVDSTHVRLIGIDTPELGHGGAPSEPGALEARAFMSSLLGPEQTVRLVPDAEARDRYGRVLAHLLLDDGTLVQSRLLEEGLATPLIVPPNLRLVHCYHAATIRAQEARRGLWALPRYQPVAVENLERDARGYRVVYGRLTRIGESRSSLWLEMGPRFALRIERGDQRNFEGRDLAGEVGRPVQARGRIYRTRGQLRMRIRHPLDLTVLRAPPRIR